MPKLEKEIMEINILITSVSRKVWLVKAFKNALQKLKGVQGKVVSVDIDPLSAGLYLSDEHYIIPSSFDDNFIPRILEICKEQKIKLIIPTRDGELMLFAKHKKTFKDQDIEVMVSDPKVIAICRDKYKFYEFLKENDIPAPKTMLPHEIDFEILKYPALVKAVEGSGGKDVYLVKNREECEFFVKYVADPVIQEFIQGEEYTIDVFADFDSKVLSVITRQRVEIISGESYKGKTKKDHEMINQAKQLAEKLGVVGHVTMQCIKNAQGIKFIEINPRFGGGAMLGIQSGADTPLLLLQLLSGHPVKPRIGEFENDLIMLRYTEDLYVAAGSVIGNRI